MNMLKATALDHFGTPGAIAACLGVTPAAVSAWDEVIPEGSAYKLEVLTHGALKVDPALYVDRPKRGQQLNAGSAQ